MRYEPYVSNARNPERLDAVLPTVHKQEACRFHVLALDQADALVSSKRLEQWM